MKCDDRFLGIYRNCTCWLLSSCFCSVSWVVQIPAREGHFFALYLFTIFKFDSKKCFQHAYFIYFISIYNSYLFHKKILHIANVCFIKIRSKHNSNTLLSLLRISMKKALIRQSYYFKFLNSLKPHMRLYHKSLFLVITCW